MRYGIRVVLVTGVGWVLVSTAGVAQSAEARLLLGGGSATDWRGVRSGAYLVAPSLALAPHPDFALSLGGRGIRFTTGEWALGGSAATALRIPLGAGLNALLPGSGEAVRTSYRATYLSGDATPALEWRSGSLILWAGARAAIARISQTPPTAGSLPLPPTAPAVTRSSIGPAFGGALRLAGSGLTLSYREEHGSPDGVALTDRTAGVSLAQHPVVLSGSLGFRRAADEQRSFGGLRVTLALSQVIAVTGAVESYPSNRLTGTEAGRAVTAGLTLSVGGPGRRDRLPTPAGIPAPVPGMTRLSIKAAAAHRVEVAGDWNGWRPVPLHQSGNGVWYADLAIRPGVYRYAFRIDGRSWTVPRGVAAVDDGFGGRSAWLTVGEPGGTATQSANRKEVP